MPTILRYDQAFRRGNALFGRKSWAMFQARTPAPRQLMRCRVTDHIETWRTSGHQLLDWPCDTVMPARSPAMERDGTGWNALRVTGHRRTPRRDHAYTQQSRRAALFDQGTGRRPADVPAGG